MNIVHSMNVKSEILIPTREVVEFQQLVETLFQCCQERMQYQSERFGLPDAELRCLLLFQNERYLTSKMITMRLNVAKSRVAKLVKSLVERELIEITNDPSDSRVKLLSLTADGDQLVRQVADFRHQIHETVLAQFTDEQRTMLLSSLSLLSRHMKTVKDLMV